MLKIERLREQHHAFDAGTLSEGGIGFGIPMAMVPENGKTGAMVIPKPTPPFLSAPALNA